MDRRLRRFIDRGRRTDSRLPEAVKKSQRADVACRGIAKDLRSTSAVTSAQVCSHMPAAPARLMGRCSGVRIVTQVLDGTYGKPAAGVRARLARGGGHSWTTVAEAETNSDGCIEEWRTWHLELGLYRIVFDSDGYFARLGSSTAYPEIIVVFRMENESHLFQVQVTLTPYSYSTYFGTTENWSGSSR
jgi:5-hydroxyisourate hydrolase